MLDEKQRSAPAVIVPSNISPGNVSQSSRASSNTSLNRLEPVQLDGGGGGTNGARSSYGGASLLSVQEPNGLPTTSFKATDVSLFL